MGTTWNFAAGPAVLPAAVLARVREELGDFHGTGQSILELPFGSARFADLARRAEQDLRSLLAIPDEYIVLFLQGGASAQFSLVPLNLLGDRSHADYIESGYWSARAVAEASRYCNVNVVGSSAPTGYDRVPDPAGWRITPGAAYMHVTLNETANGVEYPWTPVRHRTPLVADMTSSFLTRPVDVASFGVIYASAQKNFGPAGLTVVLVRSDLLDRDDERTPSVFSYRRQAQAHGRINTPPIFALYVASLVFEWLLGCGGVEAMDAAARRKSTSVYAEIDGSEGFYRCPVLPEFRSRVNVCFRLADDALTEAFLQQAEAAGCTNLRGHCEAGGVRASLYNAMPEEGARALAAFMHAFADRHG